ncbi:MAG TPA: hypothetical protein VGD40_09410 [Chryseosolibacter sp.]
MKRFLSLAIAFALLSACADDDIRSTLLTIENGGVYWEGEEHFAFVTDQNGQLLDIQDIDRNTPIHIRSSQQNITQIDLTLASIGNREEGKTMILETFTNVPAGATIKLHQPLPVLPPIEVTQFELRISDPADALSAPRLSVLPHIYNPGYEHIIEPDHYILRGQIPRAAQYVIVSAYRDGNPVYWKGAPQIGVVTELNVSDFVPQEGILSVPDNVYTVVHGLNSIKERNQVVLSRIDANDAANSRQVGYVPGFPNYLTEQWISGTATNPVLTWRIKYGAPLEDPTVSVRDLAVLSETPDDFQLSTTADFDYQSIRFNASLQKNYLQWTVHADAASSASLRWDFPQELKKYGAWVKKENFDFGYAAVIDGHGTFTYSDFLNERLFDVEKPFDRTTYSRSF